MSSATSDYNSSAPFKVASSQIYADIDIRDITVITSSGSSTSFVHPRQNDVVPLTDIDAVKNAVRNLVLTNFYEAPFQPFRGSNARALLFENADTYTAMALQREITRVITEYEPRVNRVAVAVIDQSDINSYSITINFNIVVLNTTTAVNFYLERLR
jgi:phage baseplate assembly protein W